MSFHQSGELCTERTACIINKNITSLCSLRSLRQKKQEGHYSTAIFRINQVDSPQYENELRFVWLSRGLRLPSETSFCGVFPFRRMFLPKAATFALHDPRSDGFATDFCEARYRLRSGNAPKRSGGQVAEGDGEAIRKYPRESINHRSLSTFFIAVSIETSGRVIVGFHFGTVSCGTWNKVE